MTNFEIALIIISSITLGLLIIAVYLLIRLQNFAKGSQTKVIPEKDDEALYQEAINLIQQTHRASITMLQTRFRLGYARACRIMDELERRGVVGPETEGKPRKY